MTTSIRFIVINNNIILAYSPINGTDWIAERLSNSGIITIARTFSFAAADKYNLEDTPEINDEYDDTAYFKIGTIEGEYYKINAHILELHHDLLISNDIRLERKLFTTVDNISIFAKIDSIIDGPIIIGGSSENAIPKQIFLELLSQFPTRNILRRYSEACIARAISDYIPCKPDTEQRLEAAWRRIRRKTTVPTTPALPSTLTEMETSKFVYIRDTLKAMLADADSYPEATWQTEVSKLFLLIYPQYITLINQVTIPDSISTESSQRRIDMLLVDANGFIDVLEIKKPFAHSLVRRGRYRDNYLLGHETEGAIMQTEKYLHNLVRWGASGEQLLGTKYSSQIPDDMKLNLTNPRGIVLIGRDDLSQEERADFEIMKRRYSDISDIITYDELLKRVDNILFSLNRHTAAPLPTKQ
ncbi:Shedu immune nuclease family protein [Bifidobacterium stellenboschense]|uniref:Shedu protein SduA C-terminal domain-containing protein n=1 Tax=Bifidobacterium stellenboschense TaxID=762211 RepID=A0A087DN19_9BIFI|nr:Shedu immune nuclease family protein [Bifidobacterium stellenboschense]KFI96919.1 hypothetical protein BSTEL_1828 [Bifidobacterium stellenboschense]